MSRPRWGGERVPKRRAECGKKVYGSEREARAAHRRAGYRIRIYRCEECGLLHVTNDEKRGDY